MIKVIFEGFRTIEQANEFANWYVSRGEQVSYELPDGYELEEYEYFEILKKQVELIDQRHMLIK